MRELAGILRLGKIEEIHIGGDADQNGLYEIERRQDVHVPGLVLRVEK